MYIQFVFDDFKLSFMIMKILCLDRYYVLLNENMIILYVMNYEYIMFIKRCYCYCLFFKLRFIRLLKGDYNIK